MAQVELRDEVAPVMVDVYPCLWASSVSVDYSQCDFGKKGSGLFDFCKPLSGVFRSQP
jgi:hypothetical protein